MYNKDEHFDGLFLVILIGTLIFVCFYFTGCTTMPNKPAWMNGCLVGTWVGPKIPDMRQAFIKDAHAREVYCQTKYKVFHGKRN